MPSEVLITYKIMPESIETDLEKLKEDIKGLGIIVNDTKIEPVAFGLKSLTVLITIQDQKGGADDVENKIRSLEGVQSVETEGITLI